VSLFIGTSGWDYEEWKGGFYPPDVPQSRFLPYYASVLSACEVNATFYRLQSESAVARWRQSTPDGFRFAVKAHRRLTHGRQLMADDRTQAFRQSFLESLAPLGPRLSCILFQFPPNRERDDAALERVLSGLSSSVPAALEFRHESWDSHDVRERIAEMGGTTCIADFLGPAPDRLPPGPIAYIRLRADTYSENDRAAWLSLLSREAENRDVYAFAKHEGAPAGDPHVGVGLATWLVQQIEGGPGVAAPNQAVSANPGTCS
jgi:uncharacterized protein YecE (DUF72 family)